MRKSTSRTKEPKGKDANTAGMGWLEERHRLNQRYYRGEIDLKTYLRELEKVAEKERRDVIVYPAG